MSTPCSVVIVGGGSAGTAAARELLRRLPVGMSVTLVSEESYTTFYPMLPEAVSASIFPAQVVAPLRELLAPGARSRSIMGRVTQVGTAAQRLRCPTLGGELDLPYDHLLLAFGNQVRLNLVPGMTEHELPLKTVGDALEIRNVVLRRLPRIELEADRLTRAALGHFIVIGSGFSRVEVAGELVDCPAGIRRFYALRQTSELQVTVLHDGDRLLPELPPALGEAALRSLRCRGVRVQLGVRAASVSAEDVSLADGMQVEAATVIGTVGTQANALVAQVGLATQRGRITVVPDRSVPGVHGVCALGDCALVPNAHDQQPAPPTAQLLVRQGCLLAHNLRAVVQGRAVRPFRHRSLQSMATIGHMRGVAQVFGLPLRGLPARLAWRAHHLSQMPTWGRKLRIFVEWILGMFFPANVTHLRLWASAAVLQDERNEHPQTTALRPPWAENRAAGAPAR